MKKKLFRLLGATLALSVFLTGCLGDTSPAKSDAPDVESAAPAIIADPYPEETPGPDYEWIADFSPIPTQRIGLFRQGISGLAHGFECTDSGTYFLCLDVPGETGTYLFYGDHDSDTLVKLCGRPDCDHNNEDCNAYFQYASALSYYNGYLYVAESAFGTTQLIRMNLDGTNRVTVLNSTIEEKSYRGESGPLIWNGIFTIDKTYLDGSGQTMADNYYYNLDGSMEQLELTIKGGEVGNDGDHFIVWGGAGGDFEKSGGEGRYLWDPDSGEDPQYLTDKMGNGYYGTENAYYIRDGIVYHLNYADGQEEVLLDTGLDGIEFEYLHCFPDHFVVNVQLGSADAETTSNSTLYFYNWDYEPLGQVELNFPHVKTSRYFVCGETAERIILTNSLTTPRYYIEKSDFGTGSIEIHEYNMPDVDWGEISG